MPELKAKVLELQNSVRGLSLEVEGMRQHQSSSATFILDELDDLTKAINELIRRINDSPIS